MNETLSYPPYSFENPSTISLMRFNTSTTLDELDNITWTASGDPTIVTDTSKGFLDDKALYIVGTMGVVGTLKTPITSDFTFEYFWHYGKHVNDAGYSSPSLGNYNDSDYPNWFFRWWYNHSNLTMRLSCDDGTALYSGGKTNSDVNIPLKHNGHFAFVKHINNYYLFYNGTRIMSTTSDSTFTIRKIDFHGNRSVVAWYCSGMRLCNKALYTSTSYTVPESLNII